MRLPRPPTSLALRLQTPAPWVWALFGGVVGVVLSLLLFAPARWLAQAVGTQTDGHVLLEDARGTVWSGSARLTFTGGAGSVDRSRLPSRLHWSLVPSGYGATLNLTTACCLAQPWAVWLSPRWGGLEVRVADRDALEPARWPASLLAGLGTPFNTLAPAGELSLRTQGLGLSWVAGRLQVAGTAELDVQDLSSRLSTLRPLGSYRFSLSGGATPTLQLTTLGGNLQLSGAGQWVGGALRFEGEASSTPEHQAALANLLNIIGRRDGARSLIKVG